MQSGGASERRMIQVVVCSPIPALRAGLAALIDGDPGLAVWAAAAELDGLPLPLPEGCVILADIGGLGLSSFPDSTDWRVLLPAGSAPSIALLLLAPEPLPDLLEESQRQAISAAGLRAWGAISPDASAEALCSALRALAEGLAVFSPDLLFAPDTPLESLSDRFNGKPAEDELDRLTEREMEVLRRLADGLTNKQAALALGISEHTIKFHVSAIYSKLGVMNRAEAVREGARRGWIPL